VNRYRPSSIVFGPVATVNAICQRMSHTGIGYAGIEGPWWLPAAAPFELPTALAGELALAARAMFALFDAVAALYRTPAGATCGLDALLEYKVPPEIGRLAAPGNVLAVRPDFQLQPLGHSPSFRLVATELEICPSAQGFAHAMQLGYGLAPDLVEAFARLLGGRELLIVGTSQWSEFLFDQLAFCRALAERGVRARVLLDIPIATLARRIERGECWHPPIFGVAELPEHWNAALMERIRVQSFESLLFPDTPEWPDEVGDALVFRFGYLDCFSAVQRERMRQWQESGATFLNPTAFYLDSKAVLAAARLPAVRAAIGDPALLAALDRCIPETVLVRPNAIAQLRREQAGWVVKYAGFDRGNQAWGGRSLRIGAQQSPGAWAAFLEEALALPWPVVAQRAVPTAHIDIDYLDSADRVQTMRQGATRLRSFMLRDKRGQVDVCGSHLTVSGGTLQVSESTGAVQAPVVFRG
jgi:hypothetical protein